MVAPKWEECPLCEFDPDRAALIEPSFYRGRRLPERAVIVFYRSVIENLLRQGLVRPDMELESVMQPVPIYRLEYQGHAVAVTGVPACGAPLAACIMEELIARGVRCFTACGSAGSLDSGLLRNSIVIPSGAVRDEGTSYHYRPPSPVLEAVPETVDTLARVLRDAGLTYTVGLNWTTDAPYRETRARIARRKQAGCLTVDMEYSALLAVALFRQVAFGQYLLVGDDISGETWDRRQWDRFPSAFDRLFQLALEAVLKL